jgi:ppGpp synthetase/RelA/SpoT-type nucleotidyltranferase
MVAGLHARPLARVNANLRYYIRKAGADPEVTQRLKRFSTIVHKLKREPTMTLTTMEAIGGVRAILPSQKQVLAVSDMPDKAGRWRSAASASISRAAIRVPRATGTAQYT